MSEDKTAKDLSAVWKNQPGEAPVNLEALLKRRSMELDSATRWEILLSLGAALFFIGVIAWREPVLVGARIERIGFLAVLAWVLISLYWFRDRIRGKGPGRKDALAVPGLEYYGRSLVRRRNHLRNSWLWHGPLFLACMILIAMFVGGRIVAYRGVQRVLPLILMLAVWTVFGFILRRRQANELQREIDEIEPR